MEFASFRFMVPRILSFLRDFFLENFLICYVNKFLRTNSSFLSVNFLFRLYLEPRAPNFAARGSSQLEQRAKTYVRKESLLK
jgi:hypothetical protein